MATRKSFALEVLMGKSWDYIFSSSKPCFMTQEGIWTKISHWITNPISRWNSHEISMKIPIKHCLDSLKALAFLDLLTHWKHHLELSQVMGAPPFFIHFCWGFSMNHPMFAWGTFISGSSQKNSHPRNLALNRFAHVWRQHPPGLRHLRRSRRPRGNPWFPGSAGGQEDWMGGG